MHVLSYGFAGAWPDPPKGATIENRLRGGVWLSDIAMGGDFIAYDIHIIDGVTWVMGKRPVRVCGSSRRCRLEPHGDRADSATMVFEYDDGLLWTTSPKPSTTTPTSPDYRPASSVWRPRPIAELDIAAPRDNAKNRCVACD